MSLTLSIIPEFTKARINYNDLQLFKISFRIYNLYTLIKGKKIVEIWKLTIESFQRVKKIYHFHVCICHQNNNKETIRF